MAGLSLQALAEFSYYLMRAHPNNLLNLSPLYLVLAFYWVDQWASRPADGPLRLLPLGLLALGLSAALWACAPALAGGLSHSLLGLGRQAPDAPDAEEAGAAPWSQVWRPVPLSPQSAAAVALLHADAPGQARVAVFLKPCLDVDVHLLSRTLDAFPVTNLAEDGNGPRRRARILALPDAIQAGDLVLAGADERGGWDGPPAKSSPLGAELWRRTRARFIWSPLPGAEQGVMAFRLEARP